MGYGLPQLPPHMMGRVGLMPGKPHPSADYTRSGFRREALCSSDYFYFRPYVKLYQFVHLSPKQLLFLISPLQTKKLSMNIKKVVPYTCYKKKLFRYFKRFGSSLECGFLQCKELNYRYGLVFSLQEYKYCFSCTYYVYK